MDPAQGETVKSNQALEATARASYEALARDDWGRKSLSGHERDRFFLSRRGQQFTDLSLLSGADHQGDGRAAAFLDYNRDGLTDIAVANTNKPTLTLFRNDLESSGGVIAIRLTGGAGMNADAIGARLTVKTAARSIVRELHCGEGNAAQNSKILLIATGGSVAESLTVLWPNGQRTEIPGPIANDTLLSISPAGVKASVRWRPAAANP